jgi:NAD(P)-dependent dehydrogenase (short-subunit alcohol dehydrogenase family)
MTMNWQGKSAVVAGGGSGIGQAVAVELANSGATVVIGDLNVGHAQEVAKRIASAGGRAVATHLDVTSLDSCRDIFRTSMEAFGRADALISTAGWSDTTWFLDETEEYWDRVLRINLTGAIYASRAAVEHMRESGHGSIVLTSSDAGKVGTSGETVYAAAKAGVIGFVKSLAREVSRYGIRVNAISPGPTETPLLRAQSHGDLISRMVKNIPMRRVGLAHEQAKVAVFLASDDASYVTGQTVSVSGGLTMSS